MISLTLLLFGVIIIPLHLCNGDSNTKTIVLLGQTGAGKSSLGNVLLGRDKNFVGYDHGCFGGASHSVHQDGPVTTQPCLDQWKFLGNDTFPLVRVVDTPGFGLADNTEVETIEKIVSFLRTTVKSTTVFVLVLKGTEKRFTRSMFNWVKIMEEMLGPEMWDHVVLEATHWNFASVGVRIRSETIPILNEENWTFEHQMYLETNFHIKRNLKSIFIDSYYDSNDENEAEMFKLYTKELLDFIYSIGSDFKLDNIQSAETELSRERRKLDQLEKEIHDIDEKISVERNWNYRHQEIAIKKEDLEYTVLEICIITSAVVICALIVAFISLILKSICFPPNSGYKEIDSNLSTENVDKQMSTSPEEVGDSLAPLVQPRAYVMNEIQKVSIIDADSVGFSGRWPRVRRFSSSV